MVRGGAAPKRGGGVQPAPPAPPPGLGDVAAGRHLRGDPGRDGAGAAEVRQAASEKAGPAAATHPAASHSASPSPAPSASATPTPAAAASQINDTGSGLAYTLLSSPWQPDCPGGLNQQGFGWTAGESTVAGQVNGGNWYGNACSGPLPQQYGYSGAASLQQTAQNLVNTFDPTFYNELQHQRNQVVNEPLQVGADPAWEIEFLMTYPTAASQNLPWNSELAAVVVVDLGTGRAPGVLYVSVPSNLGTNNVGTLLSSLRLASQPPGTTTSPTVSPTPPASTSPPPTPASSAGP
jgi:hypothetical protein